MMEILTDDGLKVEIKKNKRYVAYLNNKDKTYSMFVTKNAIEAFFEFVCILTRTRDVIFASFDPQDTKKISAIPKFARMVGLSELRLEHENKKTVYYFLGANPIVVLLDQLIGCSGFSLGSEYMQWIIGTLCNVPPCCIEKFLNYDCDPVKLADAYLTELNGRKDPYQIKIDHKTTTVTQKLLNYIPCSVDCKETKVLFSSYKKVWKLMHEKYGITGQEIINERKHVWR